MTEAAILASRWRFATPPNAPHFWTRPAAAPSFQNALRNRSGPASGPTDRRSVVPPRRPNNAPPSEPARARPVAEGQEDGLGKDVKLRDAIDAASTPTVNSERSCSTRRNTPRPSRSSFRGTRVFDLVKRSSRRGPGRGSPKRRIVELYEEWGKPEKADEWRKKLE